MEVDLIILGGGCAGLSLALNLAKQGTACPNTLILEKREAYSNDRTWGFWQQQPTLFDQLISKRFSRMRVKTGNEFCTLNCASTPYSVLEARDFYQHALGVISALPNIQLQLGTAVLSSPQKNGDRWKIETSNATYFAKQVVDTRPQPLSPHSSRGLYQSFYGVEVECENDLFDPSCLDLMDFERESRFPILFTYLIPSSKKRALIEITVFSETALQQDSLKPEMVRKLKKQLQGSSFKIIREESGILPMGTAFPPISLDETYVYAGLTSGAARPSTGYAFQRIQEWAVLCAEELKNKRLPISHVSDPWLIRTMDKIFISVLRSRPELAPQLFYALFSRVSTPRVIRFLSGRPLLLDCLKIVLAFPTLVFLAELPKALKCHRG